MKKITKARTDLEGLVVIRAHRGYETVRIGKYIRTHGCYECQVLKDVYDAETDTITGEEMVNCLYTPYDLIGAEYFD